MRRITTALAAAAALLAGVAAAAELTELKVCSDPDNLPYSNERREGFENKIAEIIAKDLGLPLSHYWWPHQRGLVRNTLRAGACDVLIDIPRGYDLVTWTKPYFRSAYVIAYRTDQGPKIASLDDPALRQVKRIGVHMSTPPYDVLGERGLQDKVVTYLTVYDHRDPDPSRRPTKLLEDLVAGQVDVAITWGPLAGYFAKLTQKNGGPALTLVPLQDDKVIPMTFEMSMGVKKGDQALKAKLEEAIDRHQPEIRQVLEDYGVPLLPLKPPRQGPPPGAGGSAAPPAAGQPSP
jgi:mxaJ protein